jgi:hypothetical protein
MGNKKLYTLQSCLCLYACKCLQTDAGQGELRDRTEDDFMNGHFFEVSGRKLESSQT